MRTLVPKGGSGWVKLMVQRSTELSQFGSVMGMLNLISSSPAKAFARCIAARSVHCSPGEAASVSQPAAGLMLSPSPLLLTSIMAPCDTTVSTTPWSLSSRGNTSPRDLEYPGCVGEKSVKSMTMITNFEIVRRVDDGSWKLFIFIIFSRGES